MCRRCREILCSFSKEEKLPKLSEEKPYPVVTADDGDDDVVITKMKELTLVRRIVISHLGGSNEKYRTESRRAGRQKL